MPSIHFNQKGEGFPVVLLHGFCESHQIWHDFQENLSKQYRILVPDLPGFGNSPQPDAGFSIDDIAESIHGWLKDLGISSCIMIGHSLGGYVTLAFARRYPDLLKSLGLFHSTAFPDSDEKKLIRDKTINFIQSHGVPSFLKSFVPNLFYSENLNRSHIQQDIKMVIKMGASTKTAVVIGYLRAMRDRPERIDIIKSFPKPILYIIGEHDAGIPIESSKEQAALPVNPSVHFLSNSGHMGMFEEKEATLSLVEKFIKKSLDS
ncbi:alpha/beta hydrolase [Fulvivirgaceae bacterium BMA10]|uniref:Alpha/beta hydrolase n=1 Tax=Splendidivirga corallicola TaxID=3051826 RepID=A0ABT8KLC2_9BACT|nr:alpha/beta hydrolase [Fulvivirgaceae bacterium BMA10]